VVKSLVFEAGVKSLSAFCAYNVSSVVFPGDRETTSIPQKPRARSGSLSTAAIRSAKGLRGAGTGGAASSGATSRRMIRSGRATDCRRGIVWIVTPEKKTLSQYRDLAILVARHETLPVENRASPGPAALTNCRTADGRQVRRSTRIAARCGQFFSGTWVLESSS
jgi:hypothetical protein